MATITQSLNKINMPQNIRGRLTYLIIDLNQQLEQELKHPFKENKIANAMQRARVALLRSTIEKLKKVKQP